MKTYRELYFRGTTKQLSGFVDQIGEYAVGDWNLVKRSGRWKDYLFFDYIGTHVDKARVSIYVGDEVGKGKSFNNTTSSYSFINATSLARGL